MDEPSKDFYIPVRTVELKTSSKDRSDVHVRPPFVEASSKAAVARATLGEGGDADPAWRILHRRTAGRTIVDVRVGRYAAWGGILLGDIYGARDLKGARHTFKPRISFTRYGWRAELGGR